MYGQWTGKTSIPTNVYRQVDGWTGKTGKGGSRSSERRSMALSERPDLSHPPFRGQPFAIYAFSRGHSFFPVFMILPRHDSVEIPTTKLKKIRQYG
jgi:hypothetical protein